MKQKFNWSTKELGMRRELILIFISFVFAVNVHGQITIGSSSALKVKGAVSVQGLLINNSDKLDLTETQLTLVGTNQTLSTKAPLALQGLSIEGGGTKTLKGDWTITQDLTFTKGILTTLTGKIIYAGSKVLRGSTDSYVTGIFYQRGEGKRFYPLGVGSTYLPMSLNGVKETTTEIGVQALTSGANLNLPADLTSIASNRYWKVEAVSTLIAFGASLYVPGSSIDASQMLVVVQADDANGATAINLGGGVTDDFVSSFMPVTKPVLTIGIVDKVDFRIMDLITPFNSDNINDKLKIVNIEYAFENKVTLLDRWGVPVREWKNFRNFDDPTNPNPDTFDFTKLSPGNYICVLEYKLSADAPTEKLNQMISVLKAN